MRIFKVVMRGGAKMDIEAKVMLDDPALYDAIYFFHDDAQHHLVATIKRDQIAGIIFHPQKSGVGIATSPLPKPD